MKLEPTVGDLRTELKNALRDNSGCLGRVFTIYDSGVTEPAEIVRLGGAANTGAVGNDVVTILAVLDGVIPNKAGRAGRSASSVRNIIKESQCLTPEARNWLCTVITALDATSTDAGLVNQDNRDSKAGTIELVGSLEKAGGVYIYTLPMFYAHPVKSDPDRYLLKVGMTDGIARKRVCDQHRLTGLPQDPILLRVYRHPTKSPAELERLFHLALAGVGHSRSVSKYGGTEWFETNLGALDTIAFLADCTMEEPESDI